MITRYPPNLYLDVRRPEWIDDEITGRVRYDWDTISQSGSRLVEVHFACRDILAALEMKR